MLQITTVSKALGSLLFTSALSKDMAPELENAHVCMHTYSHVHTLDVCSGQTQRERESHHIYTYNMHECINMSCSMNICELVLVYTCVFACTLCLPMTYVFACTHKSVRICLDSLTARPGLLLLKPLLQNGFSTGKQGPVLTAVRASSSFTPAIPFS